MTDRSASDYRLTTQLADIALINISRYAGMNSRIESFVHELAHIVVMPRAFRRRAPSETITDLCDKVSRKVAVGWELDALAAETIFLHSIGVHLDSRFWADVAMDNAYIPDLPRRVFWRTRRQKAAKHATAIRRRIRRMAKDQGFVRF